MRIVAALSGGVDSAVAAARLLEDGAEVIGVHLRTGVEAEAEGSGRRPSCCGLDDARDARAVAARLGLPFYVVDVSQAFDRVIGDFVGAYAEGRTPNPCVACNATVKFGRLLEIARDLGCGAVATGHYARRARGIDGRWRLLRAADPQKDQTYVLYRLTQEQLEDARFPLGDSRKDDVRRDAERLGLPVAAKAESQDLCFVPGGDYRAFLRSRAPESLVPGTIVDREGRVLGTHEGAAGFTVGQRRGLPPVGVRRYVARVDARAGRVEVGSRADVHRDVVEAGGVNWIDAAPTVGRELRVEARVRYASAGAPATLTVTAPDRIRVAFDEPVFAPAPGQALVAWQAEGVVCGGTIDA